MKTYILTKKDEYLFDLYLVSFGTIMVLLACPFMHKYFNIWSIGMMTFYDALFIYRYVNFRRKYEDYDRLVIDDKGIVCADDEWTYTMPWNNIEEIILNKGKKGITLTMNLTDGDEIEFSLWPYQECLNLYKLRRVIRHFSNRQDIVIVKFRLWFWWPIPIR